MKVAVGRNIFSTLLDKPDQKKQSMRHFGGAFLWAIRHFQKHLRHSFVLFIRAVQLHAIITRFLLVAFLLTPVAFAPRPLRAAALATMKVRFFAYQRNRQFLFSHF